MCARRHEKAVQRVIGPVERLVSSQELECDLVLTCLHRFGRQHDVVGLDRPFQVGATGTNASQTLSRVCEVQHDALRRLEVEPHGDLPLHGLAPVPRDGECDVVEKALNLGRALPRQCLGDAALG